MRSSDQAHLSVATTTTDLSKATASDMLLANPNAASGVPCRRVAESTARGTVQAGVFLLVLAT